MKKALILIVLVLFSAAIAACGPAAKSSGPASPSVSAQESASPSAAAAVNVSESASPSAKPAPASFKFTPQNMPRIDGSTATIPLISAVRSVLLGTPREDNITVSGTDNAYMQLIDGNTDVLLVYAPAQKTLDDAKQRGVELKMAPIGRDALVFLVNVKNPVKSLTAEQLIGIYSGNVTNWKEVGGQSGSILAYQRQELSGSQTMMNKLVMKGTPMAKAPAEFVISEMGALVDAVAVYNGAENAIGYNVYYYVSRMKLDENIRLMAVGGIEPSTESIASGAYPFVSDFYAVIRADTPEDSPARVLYDWMLTKDGQNLVSHEGYVPAVK